MASSAHGETILFNGGSPTARYWKLTLEEVGQSMRASGLVGRTVWDETVTLLENPQ